jgi:hypothetical protein
MVLARDLYYGLCTDDFFNNLSFSEMLLSQRRWVADETAMNNFLRGRGFSCDSVEDFMYRMLFLENEDFDFSRHRALYVSLLSLKTVGWTDEDLKDHSLSDALYDLCDSFYYPEGADDMIYFDAFPMRDERGIRCVQWTPDGSLERYLDEYRYLLDCWNEVKLDEYPKLFSGKFALIKNGKFRHHLIAGENKNGGGMSLRIWSGGIFAEEREYRFSFGNNEELEEFLRNNGVVFDSLISDDFFSDEKPYISKSRERFDNEDLIYLYDYSKFIKKIRDRGTAPTEEEKELALRKGWNLPDEDSLLSESGPESGHINTE